MKTWKPINFYILYFSLFFGAVGIFLLPKSICLAAIDENSIINLTNIERQRVGAAGLQKNALLSQAAQAKGRAILAAQTFQHNFSDKKFSSWIKESGYQYNYVGENLAINFITNEGVIRAWLNSPTHKNNLLNKNFSDIGVAVINGRFQGNSTTLVVQIFGSPLNQSAALQLPNISSYQIINNNASLTSLYDNTSGDPILGANEYYNAGLNYRIFSNLSNPKNQENTLEGWILKDDNSDFFMLASLAVLVASFLLFYLFNLINPTFTKKRNKALLLPLK